MEYKKLVFQGTGHEDDFQSLVDFGIVQSVYRVFRARNNQIYVQFDRTVISDEGQFNSFVEAKQFAQLHYEKRCQTIVEAIRA